MRLDPSSLSTNQENKSTSLRITWWLCLHQNEKKCCPCWSTRWKHGARGKIQIIVWYSTMRCPAAHRQSLGCVQSVPGTTMLASYLSLERVMDLTVAHAVPLCHGMIQPWQEQAGHARRPKSTPRPWGNP